jgi:ABC-type bacteriocin/lantibiotic exporter with double-glycine peptidase domain
MSDTPRSSGPGANDQIPLNPEMAILEDAQVNASPELKSRLAAVLFMARYHGVELDPAILRIRPDEPGPNPAELVQWIKDAGLWCRATPISFRHLLNIDDPAPIVLLLDDGSAALVVGRNRDREVLYLRDPRGATTEAPVAVNELRLKQVWSGAVILARAAREGLEDEPAFNLEMIGKAVLMDAGVLRDIGIASLTITLLSILPIFMVMRTVDIVLEYKDPYTLELVIVILITAVTFEALLSWGRKLMQSHLGARLDARLNLQVFDRLLALPIDFFEREQAGTLSYKIQQIFVVREFFTGRLLNTFIEVFMVIVLLPILFYLNATLAWTVLIAAALMAVVVAIFLRPLAVMAGRIILAESAKNSVLVESVYGIRTVKALALEATRSADWDRRVAHATSERLISDYLSNWPATISIPLQRYCTYGAVSLGAYLAVTSNTAVDVGSLTGFMLLGGRVAGPLVSLATIMEDIQRVQGSINQVGYVLNRPNEKRALSVGLRPRFEGAVEFNDVTFRYEGAKTNALEKMNFKIPAGTMLGLVGRSGSGKSTVTRLLQGINRDYSGAIKIDGTDMREINLRHIRKSFGMVLQDNFLFRGTVKDNIIAGRPGLSFEDAVRAARMAGAEEFIERLPDGYDTFIQEGSPNLSGGQKQRLAIARALVSDPRVLILDEATSALDPESEAVVNANIQRIAKGRTMVIVSHRLSSLLDCDLIMVLERGTTVDIGTHHELVERCAIYRHLWFQQNRHLTPEGSTDAATSAPTLTQGR